MLTYPANVDLSLHLPSYHTIRDNYIQHFLFGGGGGGGYVYRRIYGRKFSFTATRESLNMVIPILKIKSVAPTPSGCQVHKTARQLHTTTCRSMKSDVT